MAIARWLTLAVLNRDSSNPPSKIPSCSHKNHIQAEGRPTPSTAGSGGAGEMRPIFGQGPGGGSRDPEGPKGEGLMGPRVRDLVGFSRV